MANNEIESTTFALAANVAGHGIAAAAVMQRHALTQDSSPGGRPHAAVADRRPSVRCIVRSSAYSPVSGLRNHRLDTERFAAGRRAKLARADQW